MIETMEGGRKKQTVEKIGLAPIQREGLDYEFNVAATMDMGHTLSIGKTRCRQLANKSFRPNHSDEMADIYREWLEGGHPVVSKEQADIVRARVMALPGLADESQIRTRCLAAFKEAFGIADQLLVDDLEEANTLIARFEAEAWPDGKPASAPPSGAAPADDAEPVNVPDDISGITEPMFGTEGGQAAEDLITGNGTGAGEPAINGRKRR